MSQAKTTELLNSGLGQFGGVFINDANPHTPASGYKFTKIVVVANATVTLVGNITGITAIAFTAGTEIVGRFTSITLAGGSVIAYQGVS